MDLVLIGAGRVGIAVSTLLQRSGHRVVGVASRSPASAARAGGLLGAPVFDLPALPSSDLALLGVPAGAVEELAALIAAHLRTQKLCHFAGAAGIAPLKAATDQGIFGAALHPVQTCPDIDTALRLLPGSAWGITTSPEIASWARNLVRADLGGFPIDVAEEARPRWHAAAVTTANGSAALLSLGEAMLAGIGVDAPGDVLGPLAEGSVTTALGARDAALTMTGPVVRGEVESVRSHLRALSDDPDLLEAYRLVTRLILGAARRAGRIDGSQADSIQQALEP